MSAWAATAWAATAWAAGAWGGATTAASAPVSRASVAWGLWSDLPCVAGSEFLASCTGILRDRGEVREQRNGDGQLQLIVEADAEWLNLVEPLQVLEMREILADGTEIEAIDWRIMAIDDLESARRAGTFTIMARPVIYELGAAFVADTSVGSAPKYVVGVQAQGAEWIVDNRMIPAAHRFGMTWLTKGTIDPTVRITMEARVRTVLAMGREIERQTQHEMRLRRNGRTGYLLDIEHEIQVGTPEPVFKVGRQVDELIRSRGGDDLATGIIPFGMTPPGATEPAKIHRAAWRVASIDTSTQELQLADPNATVNPCPACATDIGPVMRDGQWVDKYFLRQDGVFVRVTGSTAPDRIRLTSVSGFSVNDDGEFRADASGTPVEFIEDPLPGKLLVRQWDAAHLRGERNYCPNPIGARWTYSGFNVFPCVKAAPATLNYTDLSGLPPNTVIGFGYLLYSPTQGVLSFIDEAAVADAGGNVAVHTTVLPTITTGAQCTIFSVGQLPDGYSIPSFVTLFLMQRVRRDTIAVNCTANGNQTSTRYLAVRNVPQNTLMTLDSVVNGGPRLMIDAGTLSGTTATLRLTSPISVTDGDPISVIPPQFAGNDAGASSPVLYLASSQGQGALDTPAITIPFDANEPKLQVRVGLEMRIPEWGASSASYTAPSVQLINNSTGAVLQSATIPDVAGLGSPYLLEAAFEYDMTGPIRVRVRVIPPSWKPGTGYVATPVLYWSYTMFGPGQTGVLAPFIDGSWATELAKQSTAVLALQAVDAGRSFDCGFESLAWDPEHNPAVEHVTVGGHVRLKSDAMLEDRRARVETRIRLPGNLERGRLTLDSRPLDLVRMLTSSAFARFDETTAGFAI